MRLLTIEHEPPKNPSRRRGGFREIKTRSFSAVKLAHVCAGMLWDGGQTEDAPIRPVWIAFASSDTEMRPFLANIKSGKVAELYDPNRRSYDRSKPTRYELLRSAGYTYTSRRCVLDNDQVGEIVVASQGDLLVLDPGLIDPDGCSFLALPPAWWVERERAAIRADYNRCTQIAAHARALGLTTEGGPFLPSQVVFEVSDLIDMAPIAAYVMAYTERRTSRPMFTGIDFALQLYLAGLMGGVFSLSSTGRSRERSLPNVIEGDKWLWARHRWADSFIEEDTASAGLMPGVVCKTTQAQLDRLLIQEVQRYILGLDYPWAMVVD